MNRSGARIEMDLVCSSSPPLLVSHGCVTSAKPCGSARSIVRWIGSTLPLAPCPRVHFQLQTFNIKGGAVGAGGSGGHGGLVTSLADVAWIEQEDSDVSERPQMEAVSGLAFRTQQHPPLRRRRSLPSMHQAAPDPQSQALVNDQAIQKISALEDELAKLRVQIAQIVQAQERNTHTAGVPPPAAPGLGPPPPPPPPPPPLPPGMQRSFSALDLIKERRSKKSDQNAALEAGPKQPEMPNMLDVLKDMSKVKLRSVKTRVEEDQTKSKAGEPADPAALIAEALKRKFAHRYRNDSECESNFSLPARESKPHSETPAFGQHMLKSTGIRKLV